MPPTYININESKSNEKSMPVTFERGKTSARFMSVPEGKKKKQEASKKEYPSGNVIRAIWGSWKYTKAFILCNRIHNNETCVRLVWNLNTWTKSTYTVLDLTNRTLFNAWTFRITIYLICFNEISLGYYSCNMELSSLIKTGSRCLDCRIYIQIAALSTLS